MKDILRSIMREILSNWKRAREENIVAASIGCPSKE